MYTQIVEFVNTHNFQLITYHALAKLLFTISRGFQGQPEHELSKGTIHLLRLHFGSMEGTSKLQKY